MDSCSQAQGPAIITARTASQRSSNVGPRQPVRRHRRPSWVMPVGAPRRSLVRHKEFRLNSGKLIGQGGELQIPRNHTMLQREDRFHQP